MVIGVPGGRSRVTASSSSPAPTTTTILTGVAHVRRVAKYRPRMRRGMRSPIQFCQGGMAMCASTAPTA